MKFKPIKYKKILLFILSLIVTAVISFIQFILGPEIIFSLFYVFPIIFTTWKTGIWSGIMISFISSAVMLNWDLKTPYHYLNSITPYINNLFTLIIFLIITYIISELKISLFKQKDLARIDPLTSIPNSRAFYEMAAIEFQKIKRHVSSISIIYMDLDNFKEVNDTFGHSAGDKLLKLTAGTIIRNIRTIDIAARLGGDEFGILLTQTGAEAAQTVAQKLKDMMNKLMKESNLPVTLSIGVITFLKAPGSVDEMIKKADELMYAAKFSGKNNIKQAVIS